MAMAKTSRIGRRARQAFGLAGLASVVLRRSALRRFPPLSLAERLATVPVSAHLDAPLAIRWNDHHVPFVEAESERDAAVGLGIVHGHLRLAMLEVMRRAAFGRIAEVAGPAAVELDRLLRTIDFPRATRPSLAMLPAATRAWIDGFADGITAAAAVRPLPPEFEILGITPEPWTAEHLFAVGRLCSADYAWKVWSTLNTLRRDADWARIWLEMLAVDAAVAGEDIPVGADTLDETLPTAFVRGSNAYAVDGSRTASGAPILAADPHLPITTPNLWLIAGFRTPHVTVWGLMIPGLPIFGVGRNGHGAWGGTNLHATSSELVDVAGEAVETVTTTVAVRGGAPREVSLRQSRFGPVVSDTKPFEMPGETVALHWLGHRASDEYTPFLGLMRARDWDDFEEAIDGYGVPGLNMIWADRAGTIGKMIAAHVPRRPLEAPPDIVVAPAAAHAHWERLLTGRDLPIVKNPAAGLVASANEAPDAAPVTISLFFGPNHRVERIAALVGTRRDLTANDLKRFQLDVYFRPAHRLARRIARLTAGSEDGVLAAIAGWDGRYHEDSSGALAFELVAKPLVEALEARSPKRFASPYWRPFSRLERLAGAASDEELAAILGDAAAAVQPVWETHRTWGALHRVHLAHPLASLPWLRPRLPALDFPVGGSNDTLMKSMHPFTDRVHHVGFGAEARFVADLSDPDATFAVLLGGQDGWPGSRTMFDQVGAWRRGDSIELPMRRDSLARAFPRVTPVAPG
jgi:penicillin amidase